MKKNKVVVYLILSIANDYNQPDEALEELLWEKPTFEYMKSKYGFTESEYHVNSQDRNGRIWIKKYTCRDYKQV